MGELVQYENRYYQWVKGDYIGRVETVKDHLDENGLNFVVFESGKRINESLLLEYLIEVPEYQAKIAESATEPLQENFQNTQSLQISQPLQSTSKINDSAVMRLLVAQKNREDEQLEISLPIKIPKREMVQILQSSFGEEIVEDLYQYIIDQLDDSLIKEVVQNKIKKFITEYYESNS
jgi:hypothetical protein